MFEKQQLKLKCLVYLEARFKECCPYGVNPGTEKLLIQCSTIQELEERRTTFPVSEKKKNDIMEKLEQYCNCTRAAIAKRHEHFHYGLMPKLHIVY
ncbi:mCG126797 [Mus musculus]|nr:mCG126797 [Mus musculus]